MPLSQLEILEILATGNFMPLVGEFETEVLECKGQPYGIDADEHKLELAKDVSALANAQGGLILIGFATRRNPTHGQDEIDRPRPFPLATFNTNQYHQVIRSWLWPPLEDSDVRVFPSLADSTRGVAAIVVPQVADENRPQLVAKTMLGSPRKIEIIFGYCERKQSHVAHYDANRLHAMLRDGLRFDHGIRDGFEALQVMIESMGIPAPSPPAAPENVEPRIADALRVVGRHDQPVFVLASIPRRALNLRSLFEARDTALVNLLEDPPRIRNSGFDLNVGYNSRIVEGRLRRVMIEGRELLEFHRDGVAIYIAPGDGDRLCWSRAARQQQAYLVNQMALVEMAYLFSLLINRLYEGHLDAGEIVELQMEILRLKKDNQNFCLEPGPLEGWGFTQVYQAPAESTTCRTEVRFGVDSPERMAVLFLSELYNWMGYEENQIPYTTLTEGVRVIDPTEILRVGR